MQTSPVPKSDKGGHLTFFRQSGWLMIATVLGGGLMFAVHSIAQKMPKDEYGVFTTMIQLITLMGVPAVGLQSVFAQQAAGALTAEKERLLASTFRSVIKAAFCLWLIVVGCVIFFRQEILAALKIANPASLWLTVVVGLLVLWRPVVQGVLQGRQNFPWLGGILVSEGIVRFAFIAVIVGILAHYAAGGLSAVLIAMASVAALGFWCCRDLFRGASTPMNWGEWLRRVIPLTFGMGVGVFMLSADMVFVQKFFAKDQTGYYAAAGMIGRALVYFTAPVAAVMFPKLARSAATGEKTNALFLAVGFTALAGACAALACTFFPELPLKVVRYDESYLKVAGPLVPWFAWCMLPVTLATVLLNSLMAQSQFRAVPWVVAVAIGYGVTLYLRHETFTQVIQTIGIFGTLLLVVTAWFTYRTPTVTPTQSSPA